MCDPPSSLGRRPPHVPGQFAALAGRNRRRAPGEARALAEEALEMVRSGAAATPTQANRVTRVDNKSIHEAKVRVAPRCCVYA